MSNSSNNLSGAFADGKNALLKKLDVNALLTWAVDFIAVVVISMALTLFVFEFLAFDLKIWHVFAVVFCDLLIIVTLSRRWWVIPVLIGILAVVSVAIYLRGEVFEEILEYITGFAQWIGAGMTPTEPYSYNGSIMLVEMAVALPVCTVVYVYIRKFFSFIALCVTMLGCVCVLFYLDMATLEPLLLLMLPAAVLTLPRVTNRRVNKGKLKDEQISRVSMQIIAVPVAIACIALTTYFVPEGEVVWRSEGINTLISDIRDIYDYYVTGDGSGVGGGFDIGASGYMPLKTRLGGDINLNNNRVLRVKIDNPTYLAGNVQDTYDGHLWYDGWGNGRFRLGSFLWRGKRIEAFSQNLPVGGREADELYSKMITTASYEISPVLRNMRAYLTGGSLKSVQPGYSDASNHVYFNMQGELSRADFGTINSRYLVETVFLDRSRSNFDSNMKKLEQIAYQQADPNMAEINKRYKWLPESLPQSVRDMAAGITAQAQSPYEMALALEQWISDNCKYTMTPGTPPEDRDFVEYFLETREGYCTYFATAMAVMGRTVGLPTRYVTGYGLREVDAQNVTATHEALNSSAHAWCEVYFSGIGWVIFDPVVWDYSPLEIERKEVPVTSAIGSLLEEDFGEDDEESTQWGYSGGSALGETEAAKKLDLRVLYYIAGIAAAALLIWLLIKFEMNRFFRRYTLRFVNGKYQSMAQRVDYYYKDIVKQLSFWGVTVDAGDTIETLCRKADRYVKLDFHSMKDIGEIVMRQRYGMHSATVEELRKMEFYHEALETRLKESMSGFMYFAQRIVMRGDVKAAKAP